MLLIEGQKFPSFNFQFSSNSSSTPAYDSTLDFPNFKIKNQPIYLYYSPSISKSKEKIEEDDKIKKIGDHAVLTSTSVWDAVKKKNNNKFRLYEPI